MKLTQHIYAAALLCLSSVGAMAQNIYYSQFHHAQQLTNPASVATTNDMSVMLNFRRQWSGVGDGYMTPALSFSRPLLKNNDADKRFGGFGISILQDRAGQNGYVKTTGGTAGYAHNLRITEKVFVALGLQAGFYNRTLDAGELTSGSQWNGTTFDPNAALGEDIGSEGKGFLLVNGGLMLYGQDSTGAQTYNLGFSMYNINQPETGTNYQNKLSQNMTITGSVRAWRNDKFSIVPNARFVKQGNNAQQVNVGSLFRYHTGANAHLGMGAWYSLDNAVVASVEFYQPSYIVGLSYDFGASSLKNGGKSVGAPELALAWRKTLGVKIVKPKDTDKDGIPDTEDDCPLEKGLPEFKGCPDTDGDGVMDKKDDCVTEKGEIALNGCPDRDKDGISDSKDECPDVPGVAQFKGCPDADGDGIQDKEDACVNEKGTLENKGCPVMVTIKGTVLDAKTRKPLMADVIIQTVDNQDIAKIESDSVTGAFSANPIASEGKTYKMFVTREGYLAESVDLKDKAGNKVSSELTKEILLKAIKIGTKTEMKHLNFEVNKAIILPESYAELDKWVLWLNENPKSEIEIDGHTDNTGNNKFNMGLSQDRAVSVKSYLVGKGIKAKRLKTKGYGSTKPVADNATEEGKTQNRRVELIIMKVK
jgi:type IX secretion system PorP/SprF family membrane protein